MASPALELDDVTVWRGNNKVFDGLSLRVASGEQVAVLGPNGAGKSTLLALIAGDVHPVAGQGSSRLFGEEHWSLYDLRERVGLITPEQRGLFDDDELASDVVLTGLHGTYGITRGQTFTTSEKLGWGLRSANKTAAFAQDWSQDLPGHPSVPLGLAQSCSHLASSNST